MQKTYFELDKVDSITLSMEKESDDYYWKEAVPARPKKFLGITIGTRPEVPAGWSEYEEEYEEDYRRRKQKSYFDQYSWYRIDEKTKQIFIKPHVEVRFGYKQSIGRRFESDTEAQSWVDELIQSSPKQFHVIINK
jgi:hypothetical protein